MLEHLDATERPRAARELTRVARHHVVLSVPYRERLLESSARCPRCGRVFHLHGHRDSLDEADLRALFPGARRLVFDYSWPVRPFNRALLKLRTGTFGLWKHTAYTVCPHCGNQEFPNDQTRPLYKVLNGLNMVLHPRRSAFNWLLLRVELG